MNRFICHRLRFHDKRFISTIEKYHDKLLLAAKEKGFSSIEAMIAAQKSDLKKTTNAKESQTTKQQTMNIGTSGRKKLDQILNMDKIKGLESKAISEIWNSYLSQSKNSLSATLPAETWKKQLFNLTKYPTFLIAKPLDDSCQFYFMEYSNSSIYLTRLDEYQKYGANAKPLLELHFYTDLIDKDLVLLKGDILDESLNLVDAQYLIYQVQYWYFTGKEKTLDIISKFHNDPKNFDYKWVTEFNYFER